MPLPKNIPLKRYGNKYINTDTGEVMTYRQALNLGAREHGFPNHNQLKRAERGVVKKSSQGYKRKEFTAEVIDPLAAHTYLYNRGLLKPDGMSNIKITTKTRTYSTRVIYSEETDYIALAYAQMEGASDELGELEQARASGTPLLVTITDYL